VTIRQALRAAALLPALIAGPTLAQGLPDEPDQGRALAERWCVDCHEVAPARRKPWAVQVPPSVDREPGVVEVPTFQTVADDPAATEAALRAFLRTPHAAMPDLRLTLDQTDDVVAYVLSLKGRRPGT
jgi:mono/diheme cytochrome c family protein